MNENDYSSYYKVGGALPEGSKIYVKREADRRIYHKLKNGDYCYVLNSRQTGKTSLRNAVIYRLKEDHITCVSIDLSSKGTQNVNTDKFYCGILLKLKKELNLSFNLKQWWKKYDWLSDLDKLSEFVETILLKQKSQSIVIFIDEIDHVLGLNFSCNDFFAWIRACYNKRSVNTEYSRLTFCLLGVATPSDLIQNKKLTPFNIGYPIELSGLLFEDAKEPLTKGLPDTVKHPEEVLKKIIYWTGGQPFLTQKLCDIVAKNIDSPEISALIHKEGNIITELVTEKIINNWSSNDEPIHLRTIQERI